ncbi:unnamed protein product [Meganyctiphanes norvegica]|uniref:Uncharacterized protein n=1 Tax=Meganyctiphanes norvegica TaxID=48144 RepID=A0AAV2Q8D8_MEGNR
MDEIEDIKIVCVKSKHRSRKKHKKEKYQLKHEIDERRDSSKHKSNENKEKDNRKRHKKKRSNSKYEDEYSSRRKRSRYEHKEIDKKTEDNANDIIELYSYVKRKVKRKKEKKRKSTSYCSDDDLYHIKQENKKETIKEEIIVDDDSDFEVTMSKYKRRESDSYTEIKKSRRSKTTKKEKKVDSQSSTYYSGSKKSHNKDNYKKDYCEKYVDENRKKGSKSQRSQEERGRSGNEYGKERHHKLYCKKNNTDKHHKNPVEVCDKEGNKTLDTLTHIKIIKKALKEKGSNGKEKVKNNKSFQKNFELHKSTAKEILSHNGSEVGSSSSISKNIEEILRRTTNREKVSTIKESSEIQLNSLVEDEICQDTEIDIVNEIRAPQKYHGNRFTHQLTDSTLINLENNKAMGIGDPQKNNLNSLAKNTPNHISIKAKDNQDHEHHISIKSDQSQEYEHHLSRISIKNQEHEPYLRRISNRKNGNQDQTSIYTDRFSSSKSAISSGNNTVTKSVEDKSFLENNRPSKSSSKKISHNGPVIASQVQIILAHMENSKVMFNNTEKHANHLEKQVNENNLVLSSENKSQYNNSIKPSEKNNNDNLFKNIEYTNRQQSTKYNLFNNIKDSFWKNQITNNLDIVSASQDLLEVSNELKSVSNESRQIPQKNTTEMTVCPNKQPQIRRVVDDRNMQQESEKNKRKNCTTDNSKAFEYDSYQLPSTDCLEKNNSINESLISESCENLFIIENVQGNVNFKDDNVSCNDLNKTVLNTSDVQTSGWPIKLETESVIMTSSLNSEKEKIHNFKVSCTEEEIITKNEIHSQVYDQVDSKAYLRSVINNECLENFDTESKVILHARIKTERLQCDNSNTNNGCNKNPQEIVAQAEKDALNIVQGHECQHTNDDDVNFSQNENEIQNESINNSSIENNENHNYHESANSREFGNVNKNNTTTNILDLNQSFSLQNQLDPEPTTNIHGDVENTSITLNRFDSVQYFPPESNTIHSEISSSESPMFQIENVWSVATASHDNANHYPIPEDLAEVVEVGRVEVTKTSACSFRIKRENQDDRNYYVAHNEIEQCPMCEKKLNIDQFKFNPSTMILTKVCTCTLTIYQLLNPDKYKGLKVR